MQTARKGHSGRWVQPVPKAHSAPWVRKALKMRSVRTRSGVRLCSQVASAALAILRFFRVGESERVQQRMLRAQTALELPRTPPSNSQKNMQQFEVSYWFKLNGPEKTSGQQMDFNGLIPYQDETAAGSAPDSEKRVSASSLLAEA